MNSDPNAIVRFINVNKRFQVKGQTITAIEDFSLSVGQGELIAIVGSSGCGKSTLLRLLVGLDTDYQGTILVDNQPISGVDSRRGIVFQEARLFPWLTVEQNVALGLISQPLDKATRRQRVEEFIQLVGLSQFPHALPGQLSGGMAQRVAIARGLVSSPKILLMDEPYGALDALTRRQMQEELLRIHQQRRTTTILVTHDVEEAVFLADRVVIMAPRPGRIQNIISINLPAYRQRAIPAFREQCNEILSWLTETPQVMSEL